MTTPSIIDPTRFLHEQLAEASPDMLRQQVEFAKRVATWFAKGKQYSLLRSRTGLTPIPILWLSCASSWGCLALSLGLLRVADGRSVPAFEGRHHPYCDHEEAPCGGPRESGRPSPPRRPGRLGAPAVSQACLAPHEGRRPARTPSEGVETHDHRWG